VDARRVDLLVDVHWQRSSDEAKERGGET
jgi:hypothetical protein